jgi:hypothetical protein
MNTHWEEEDTKMGKYTENGKLSRFSDKYMKTSSNPLLEKEFAKNRRNLISNSEGQSSSLEKRFGFRIIDEFENVLKTSKYHNIEMFNLSPLHDEFIVTYSIIKNQYNKSHRHAFFHSSFVVFIPLYFGLLILLV